MTHIQKVRNDEAHVLGAVLTFTGISEAEHSAHMYEMGCQFLAAITQDEEAASEIQGSKLFWGWWKKEWFDRDNVYTSTVQMVFHTDESRRRIWYDWHSLSVFFDNGTTAQRLSSGFSDIVGLIIRQATKRQA